SGQALAAWTLLTSEAAQKIMVGERGESSFFALAVNLGFDLARYRDVVRVAHEAVRQSPPALRTADAYLKSAFSAGKVRKEREALEFFGRQYELISDSVRKAGEADLDGVIDAFQRRLSQAIADEIMFQTLKLGRSPKIGVFFLSSTD